MKDVIPNDKTLAIFQSADGSLQLDVKLERETVWLSQQQMADLFDRDRTVIKRHINNAISEGEVDPDVVCAKFAHTTPHGAISGKTQVQEVEYYNLDVIISVGYRVKSQRGVEFRRWATRVLKDYIVKGVAVNDERLKRLGQMVEIMRRAEKQLDAKEVLDVVERYSQALDLLDDYDHQCMPRPEGTGATYVITYEECREVIESMRFGAESSLFGNEKDDSFRGSIGAIYQTAFGQDVYPTLEEKAANLLYFVTKNHSFSDGNKRIAAALFLYFLDKNHALFRADGSKRIADHTLVALTIMIAESRPQEKEMMVTITMNAIATTPKD